MMFLNTVVFLITIAQSFGLGITTMANEAANNYRQDRITVIQESADYANIELDTVIYNQLSGEIRAVKGCGPTCLAMVLASETPTKLTKDEALRTAYENGFFIK